MDTTTTQYLHVVRIHLCHDMFSKMALNKISRSFLSCEKEIARFRAKNCWFLNIPHHRHLLLRDVEQTPFFIPGWTSDAPEWTYCFATMRTDPRSETHDACKLHASFIFNLHKKSYYIYRSFITIFTRCTAFSPNPTPHIINRTTPLFLLGEPASLLMVTNTHPPLSLVCQQLPHPLLYTSHPFTPTVQITLFT